MIFTHCTGTPVLNRGVAPNSFLTEMVLWAKTAPDALFAENELADIYSKIRMELGPWNGLKHRKAAMLEVLRVLAGFESSWDWTEGVDTSRFGPDTPENKEAGAWQISYDSRRLAWDLRQILAENNIIDGVKFQQKSKFNHPFAMTYVAQLLRFNTKHNGPLYKGSERNAIRKSLRGDEHSIYPWLRRECVAEFQALL